MQMPNKPTKRSVQAVAPGMAQLRSGREWRGAAAPGNKGGEPSQCRGNHPAARQGLGTKKAGPMPARVLLARPCSGPQALQGPGRVWGTPPCSTMSGQGNCTSAAFGAPPRAPVHDEWRAELLAKANLPEQAALPALPALGRSQHR